MGKSTKRPFIAYYFDALEEAEAAARAARVDPDVVIAGLVRLWRDCWRKKRTRVPARELGQFFAGADERLRQALSVDFLELDDEQGDLVRGAEQYLRIREARSKGGHAAKGNLRRGKAPGSSPAPAGEQPEEPPGSAPALTATSDQRSATKQPPKPPSARGADQACRCTRSPCRHQATGRVLEIGQCAACGAGASAGFGGVKLCYGGCIEAGERWAREQNPEKPWEADIAGWAMAQRAMRVAEATS